jgi:ribosomal-protein-alanine N-acetyltransferase
MFLELQTARINLVKVTADFTLNILEGLSNPVVTQFMLIHYNNLKEVQEQMQYYEAQYNNNNGMYWAMLSRENSDFIGVIGITNLSQLHKKAELGFWILPQFFNKGYTTEAAKTVLQFCFNNLGLNRVEATVETENKASLKLLKKLWFTHEGTFREYEINKGKVIDLMMYSILKSEFKND